MDGLDVVHDDRKKVKLIKKGSQWMALMIVEVKFIKKGPGGWASGGKGSSSTVSLNPETHSGDLSR